MNVKLSTKLMATYLLVGIIPVIAVAVIFYYMSSNALTDVQGKGIDAVSKASYGSLISLREIKDSEVKDYFTGLKKEMGALVDTVQGLRQEAFSKLESIQNLKKLSIERLFSRMREDVISLSKSRDFEQAFADFKKYHDDMKTDPTGPLDVSTDEYKKVNKEHSGYLSKYVKVMGYEDVYLICFKHGHVLFSKSGKSDLGNNLGTGPLKDSGLAKLWGKVVKTRKVCVDDFEPYAPDNNAQTAFMGGPVFNAAGAPVAVVALKISQKKLQDIVGNRIGLGKSGDSYVAGKLPGDKEPSLRSIIYSMGADKYHVGVKVQTEYLKQAFEGKTVNNIFSDTQGNLTLVSASKLDIPGLDWVCVSKINAEEAFVPHVEGQKDDYLTKYLNNFSYYDIFLIAPNGYCFYTVCHEADYKTNLIDGKFSSSNLGELVREVSKSGEFGMADFKPYAPSAGVPASFIAQPVLNNGKCEMIVAVQISDKGLSDRLAVGCSKESELEAYLVGSDQILRSNSILYPDTHTITESFKNDLKITHDAVNKALAGNTGEGTILNYKGTLVLSTWQPLDIYGVRFALVCEQSEKVGMATKHNLEKTMGITIASATNSMIGWGVGLTLACTLIVGALGILIAHSISKPINHIIDGLNSSSTQVASAAGQISSSSQSLAEGATEQAASLEQTSSSLEEMSSMTKQNADNAQEANKQMDIVSGHVRDGGEAVKDMSGAMKNINESSEKISMIIKTIEEIAFQTNLLALNAAVEAARAGDAGKGFAVVADEVRNLAQRSAVAARNTADLIESTVERVKKGTDIVGRLQISFGDILSGTEKINGMIAQISTASLEQAQGVDQVNTAVAQMDKVTQTNAANSEESASAAEELSSQAVILESMVESLAALIEGRAGAGNVAGEQKPVAQLPYTQNNFY